jgi:hypothetical protein
MKPEVFAEIDYFLRQNRLSSLIIYIYLFSSEPGFFGRFMWRGKSETLATICSILVGPVK